MKMRPSKSTSYDGPTPGFMDGALSLYLDVVRFGAALLVVVSHLGQDRQYTAWIPLPDLGHEAVVVFFVLSGLVIAHSTANGSKNWRQYLIARVSRIYAVALPAVLFSVLALFAGVWFGGAAAPPWLLQLSTELAIWDLASSLLFLNESYLNGAAVPLNAPYWSLCYEVWYYAMFGVFIFARGRGRWIALIALGLCAGPAIVGLFPLWLLGAWLAPKARLNLAGRLAWWIGLLPMSISIAFVLILADSELDELIRKWMMQNVPGYWMLGPSSRLLTDYLIGAATVMNFVSFTILAPKLNVLLETFTTQIRYLAGATFSVYLFHRPISMLAGAYFPDTEQSVGQFLLVFLLVLILCFALAEISERRTSLWRRWMSRRLEPRDLGRAA